MSVLVPIYCNVIWNVIRLCHDLNTVVFHFLLKQNDLNFFSLFNKPSVLTIYHMLFLCSITYQLVFLEWQQQQDPPVQTDVGVDNDSLSLFIKYVSYLWSQHSSFLFLALFNILSLYLAMGCKVRNNTGDKCSVYRSLLSNQLHQLTDVKGLLSKMTEHVGLTLKKCDEMGLLVSYISKKNVLERISQKGLNQSVTFLG